jgi:hypothetical protein
MGKRTHPELAATYPEMIWMGDLDGVSTLEFGSEEDVIREVGQIIDVESPPLWRKSRIR